MSAEGRGIRPDGVLREFVAKSQSSESNPKKGRERRRKIYDAYEDAVSKCKTLNLEPSALRITPAQVETVFRMLAGPVVEGKKDRYDPARLKELSQRLFLHGKRGERSRSRQEKNEKLTSFDRIAISEFVKMLETSLYDGTLVNLALKDKELAGLCAVLVNDITKIKINDEYKILRQDDSEIESFDIGKIVSFCKEVNNFARDFYSKEGEDSVEEEEMKATRQAYEIAGKMLADKLVRGDDKGIDSLYLAKDVLIAGIIMGESGGIGKILRKVHPDFLENMENV